MAFLFTDLEGSTRLLEAHPAAYRDAVRRLHALLRGTVEAAGGAVFETVGDAVYAAFAQATDAVAAALAGQVALHQEPWDAVGPLRARMGVHLGEAERQGGHYFGAPLYRAGRLAPGGPRRAGGALGGGRRAGRGRPPGGRGPARPGHPSAEGPAAAGARVPARPFGAPGGVPAPGDAGRPAPQPAPATDQLRGARAGAGRGGAPPGHDAAGDAHGDGRVSARRGWACRSPPTYRGLPRRGLVRRSGAAGRPRRSCRRPCSPRWARPRRRPARPWPP